jgi:hypothetical protein
MILALTLVTASIILGLCLAYWGGSRPAPRIRWRAFLCPETSFKPVLGPFHGNSTLPISDKVEPPQSVPTPEIRVERRNGVMWSVTTCENGTEIWSIIWRAA